MSFSLTYLLTKEDFSSYEKKLKIATYLNRFKSMLLPLILIVAAGIFMGSGYVFSGIFFFLAMIVFPDIINSEYKNKTAKASLLLKKPITVEFYEDHFVVRCDPDEISKSFSSTPTSGDKSLVVILANKTLKDATIIIVGEIL